MRIAWQSIENKVLIGCYCIHARVKKLGGTLKDGETVVETKQRGDEITVVTSNATYRSHDLFLCLGPWIVDFLKRHFGVSLPLVVGYLQYLSLNTN